ncbi:MAG: hypothetical protein HC866_26945 [Leptolyngbyaceae cyanobacterium RU_5_1]|nr:hypothetical protein [Leptolyngbyaceae cyanobacterium RU_5_1]
MAAATVPGRLDLSRFLSDINTAALEQLRTLFESDLLVHGFEQTQSCGLVDRAGNQFWVFDVDGTHQTTRQRSLTTTESYPELHRRSQAATAKGYLGRGRGEVTRTRSTVSLSHTSEWLGTFGAAGNGTPGEDLERACGVIGRYLQQHQQPGMKAIIRLDGYYGLPQFVNRIQHHQFGYLLRCRDYALLQHQALQARLQQTPKQEWMHPESHQVREVFDVGLIDDGWAGYTEPIRLIVVRTPYNPNRAHRVGKRIGDFIYELFITSLAQAGLTGPDLLSLYYGRGGFEKQLGDEDREGDCDRWCSWHPDGQEFWQILSQWVWNWRLWAGFAHHPQAVRKTLWVPPQSPPEMVSESPSAPTIPLTLSDINATCPPVDSPDHGPTEVCSAWARSIGKFSGQDFKLLDERTLQCPAGHRMYRREVRQNRLGDLLILFGINPRTCQQCPLKEQCLAEGSKGTGGRRVTVIRKKLPLEPNVPTPVYPSSSISETSTPSHVEDKGSDIDPPASSPPLPSPPSGQPVLWLDFPTTHLRRDLSHQLRQHQIVIQSVLPHRPLPGPQIEPITRDQRAHRRLTWTQRWNKNTLTDAVVHWNVQLFGISSAVLNWLNKLKPGQPVIN